MNLSAAQQHPCFDVFKTLKIEEWKNATKEGDIKVTYDKAIAKHTVLIGGATSASNYIQIPATKNGQTQSLGLTGKFIYVLLCVQPNKNFVMHFEYMVNDTRICRLSASNIYRELQFKNGSSIQVPLNGAIVPNKWTVLQIDALHFLKEAGVFSAAQGEKFVMRSMQLQSSMAVQGVYTSDMAFTAMTLPKQMRFKPPKAADWFAEYAWLAFPEGAVAKIEINADLSKACGQENSQSANAIRPKSNFKSQRAESANGKSVKFITDNEETKLEGGVQVQVKEGPAKKQAPTRPKSAAKGKTGKLIPKGSAKKGATQEEEPPQRRRGQAVQNEVEEVKLTPEELYEMELKEAQDRQAREYEEKRALLLAKQRQGLEVCMEDINFLKQEYETSLESKHITQNAELLLHQETMLYDPNKSQKRNSEEFVLRPDPILALDRVVGIHPKFSAGQVYFNKDAKMASEILYCQANLLLGYHSKLQKQRLFHDKLQTTIEKFIVTKKYAVTFCKQPTSASANRGNRGNEDIMVTIWDLEENQEPVFQFRPPLSKLKGVTLSQDSISLSLNGKDFQGRELILVYAFQDLAKFQKVELLARQLCDFDLVSLKFNEVINSCLIGCGRENIRFFKIKNNFLPSQLVSLNNTARGKVFNNSTCTYKLVEDTKSSTSTRKVSQVLVSTECGLLYIINYFSRQVDKIVQVHEEAVQSLVMAPPIDRQIVPFYLTASRSGNLRIWSPDFSKLVSEVSINQEVASCDINVDQKEISVLSTDGSLSLLELESSSFRVLIRSHQDDIVDLAHNSLTGALVTIGQDSSVKVWHAETMEQIHEFNTSSIDPPTSIASSQKDVTVAVGFKSGFLRIFNLAERKMVHETMIFQSAIMDISFSPQGKFMSTFFKNNKIVIFNLENGLYTPVKNIDYEFPNANYFSLDFSPDDQYLANISSNANIITVWETRNFSLRWYIDLTGEVISKVTFAPNGKDLLVLTTTSKLKVLRIDPHRDQGDVPVVREQYGITDKESTDLQLTKNGKFIFVAGKENIIRIYDYFMRGKVIAAQQAFSGHLQYASKLVIQEDMRFMYSIGPGNGIYKWAFFGDKQMPLDMLSHFEKLPDEIAIEQAKEGQIPVPAFEQGHLKTYTEQQIAAMRSGIIDAKSENQFGPTSSLALPRPFTDLIKDGGLSLTRAPKVEYTPSGYVFEQHDIVIEKLLGCTIAPKVNQNLVWDRKRSNIVYSMQNILIFEELNATKTQALKNECNDFIYEVKMSPDQNLLLAFTKTGQLDGFPQIIVWNAQTRRKVSQIAIDDQEIVCVQFSNSSNSLLVVSSNGNHSMPRSTIAIWDFLDGRKEYLAKSVIPFLIIDARWNPYLKTSAEEFVTISEKKYHYWRVTEQLQMQFQLGDLPKSFVASSAEKTLTSLSFVEPMMEQNSVYLLIGLSDGCVWVLDTRSNSFINQTKILDCPVSKLVSSVARIIIEGAKDTQIRSWELKKTIGDFEYDASNPDYFFAGQEQVLSLDGFPSASQYDETAAEAIFISTNGTFWLFNFLEGLTIKLKSCHSPEHPVSAVEFKYVSPNEFHPEPSTTNAGLYEFDQNYLIGSAGTDGIIKVWNMYDMEHCLNFIVPKEECLSIAMHQFKPYIVCSFSDGYIRFFDLQDSRNLGRCKIMSPNEEADPAAEGNLADPLDYVVSIKILPSGQHMLCATKNGQIFLIYVENWVPLSIKITNLVSLNTAVHSFDVSFLEPYNKWLVGTANGKVIVYNRQDCNSFKQELFDRAKPPTFIFMDSFNVQEYVDNCFTEAKRVNTLDHYYSLAKRNLVYNEVAAENETQGIFLNIDLASHISYVRKSNNLFIRNFELHQVVKRIQLEAICLQMQIGPGSTPYVYLIQEDNTVRMIDFVNEANQSKIKTIHDNIKTLKVCPNGRYVLSGGDKGDVILYSVRRQTPETVKQMARDAFPETDQLYKSAAFGKTDFSRQ